MSTLPGPSSDRLDGSNITINAADPNNTTTAFGCKIITTIDDQSQVGRDPIKVVSAQLIKVITEKGLT